MENKDIALIFLAALLVLILFSGGYGMMNYGYGYGMMSGYYGLGSFLIFGILFKILVLVVIVLFVIWLIKQTQSKNKKK